MSYPLRRVVLVDDHGLFRAGVRSELGKTVEIVDEVGSVLDAVSLIRELDPDVVLLDVHLPDGGGEAVIVQVALELTAAIHRIADGDAVFSPRLAGFVLDAFKGGGLDADPELDLLTAREREVLQLIARGYRYKEIAARLHLSVKTVETHVSAVLRKLQLSSRHELTRWAAQRRLI